MKQALSGLLLTTSSTLVDIPYFKNKDDARKQQSDDIGDHHRPMSMYPKMNVISMEGSKYHYLEIKTGFEIDGAFQDFEAIIPDKHMCEILGVSPRKPLIQLLSTGKLVDGRIFEYTKIISKPETMSYRHYLKR